ncbi:MAG: DUF2849 domain-containing protein [Pseudomonadota bacterium]
MAKVFKPKVVTANDLLDGDVIWLGAEGQWMRRLDDAVVFETQATADDALASAAAQKHRLVGAYLADVALQDGRPVPIHFREEMRAAGAFAELSLTP